MKRRTKYENLALLPFIAAETVCGLEYTAKEWSKGLVSAAEIKEIEKRRKKLTPKEIEQFAEICDARCKRAYEVKADWFEKCVQSKTNAGRDLLFMFIIHWMTGFLMNREAFVKRWAIDKLARS